MPRRSGDQSLADNPAWSRLRRSVPVAAISCSTVLCHLDTFRTLARFRADRGQPCGRSKHIFVSNKQDLILAIRFRRCTAHKSATTSFSPVCRMSVLRVDRTVQLEAQINSEAIKPEQSQPPESVLRVDKVDRAQSISMPISGDSMVF